MVGMNLAEELSMKTLSLLFCGLLATAVLTVQGHSAPNSTIAGTCVKVFAEVSGTQHSPGDVVYLDFGLQNFSSDTLGVQLVTVLTDGQGRQHRLTNPTLYSLAPDEGVVNFGTFLLPTNAPLGQTKFHVVAKVVSSSSGTFSGPQLCNIPIPSR